MTRPVFDPIVRNMSNYRNINSEHFAEMFKALSNPHRLAVFKRLMICCAPGTKCSPQEAQRYCIRDLGSGLDIAASTLSHHVKELQRAGLIQMERRGKNIDCWIEPETLDQLANFFNQTDLKGETS